MLHSSSWLQSVTANSVETLSTEQGHRLHSLNLPFTSKLY